MATKLGVQNNPEVKQLAEANFLFTADLHNALKLKPEHQKNLIYSPFSLSVAIAMTKIGARGKTADEIAAGLRFPLKNQALANGYTEILRSLQEISNGFVLSMANRLYSMTGFPLNAEFVNVLKNSFYSETQQLNFAQSVESADAINPWVEKTTNDKIKDLISPRSLNDNTRLVLVNGIYFKGLWASKFDLRWKSKARFHISDTEEVQVDMMRLTQNVPYVELQELDAQALALPYKGGRLCMLLVIPKEKLGLSKIESGFKNLNPGEILGRMLGMNSMFNDSEADFSGIHPTERLFVSRIIQKAFVEVNEEGSEAAAATVVAIHGRGRCAPRIIEVNANRPFLFQITDRQT